MKGKELLSLFLILFVLSCQKTAVSSGSANSNQAINASVAQDSKKGVEEVWRPRIIEECISKAESSEPIEIEDLFNPFYLRADFDGNEVFDYAVLVRSVSEKKKRGLLICKDSKEPFLYGVVSKSKIPFSDMLNDNFVTSDWEILSKEETKTVTKDSNGTKVGNEAKGESIGFIFEGGGFFIYWNGKKFVGIGGA